LIWAILWLPPIALLSLWLGNDHTVVREGWFFSKAALVTFGGAYAVLPYVAQQAVKTHHWLTAGQMLDGLGLAETTPGPLIMVTQFVGSGRLESSRETIAVASRFAGRLRNDLDNFYTLLPLDISGRPVHRKIARE
jgi:chromate transporter